MGVLAINKTAKKDYHILQSHEAGIVLRGHEVKSVKLKQIELRGSYVSIDSNNNIWLVACHIAPYKPSALDTKNFDTQRRRRLLLHKKEITSLTQKAHVPGLTIVPLSVYTKGSFIKVEIGIARGKKKYDKREAIKKREVEREIRRRIRGKY